MVYKNNKKTSRRNVKSRKGSRKTKTMKRMKVMRGGDTGAYGFPPSYYGKGLSGYYSPGSPELIGSESQIAVSAGSVRSNCKMAGPNLYPMLGGGCNGCIKRRSKKSKHNKTH